MRKLSIVTIMLVMALVLIGGFFVAESQARLSDNNRCAVVLETFYALRTQHDGGCDKTIGGNCVSSWAYLYSDTNAYSSVKSWYGSYSSEWSLFFTDLEDYSYGTHSGDYGDVGRGGQCKYFADLILYRSESQERIDNNTHTLPNYSTMLNDVELDLTEAKEGDVIFTYNCGITNHVAIVVEIKKNGQGEVTGLDVIDANYISDISPYEAGREVIGRHLFGIDFLQTYYYIWTGTTYYDEDYEP